MDNNTDYSYLNTPDPIVRNKEISDLSDIIKQTSTIKLSSQDADNLYSFGAINNAGVDKRRNAIDYSTKFDEAYVTLSDGDFVARYKDFLPNTNNEERLAQQQTTTEKWGNGFAKLAGKTGTAVLGGTIGVVDSLISGISKGSLSEAYNSSFNVWLDDLNTKMDYKLPNYYTEQEKDASLFGQMGQANFYADKLFGGLSFMTGAIISEGIWGIATGGAGTAFATEGLLARLSKYTAKGLGSEAKVMQALNSSKVIASGSARNALETGALAVEGATDVAGQIAKAGGFGIADETLQTLSAGQINSTINKFKYTQLPNIVLTATRSAGYESGMEARLYMKQTEHAWLEKYEKENGREPSSEEYTAFKDQLTTSANMVFAANMAIVAPSNAVQFSNALFGKSFKSTITNNYLERTLFGKGFDKVVTEEGKTVLKALEATKGQKVFGRVYGVGKNVILESQEEMGQAVASGTAENYMLNAYDRDKTKTTYGMAESFYDALEKTYTTKEGLTEGLIGGLIGILGGSVGGAVRKYQGGDFFESEAELKEVQKNVDYANALTTEMHINNVIASNKIQGAQEKKDEAIRNGDAVAEVLSDRESNVAKIERDFAIGGVEEGFNDFSLQIRAVDEEYLAKELEIPQEEVKAWKAEKIQEYKTTMDNHVKNLRYAEALLGEKDFAGSKQLKTNTREVQRAIAYAITMGQASTDINQNLVVKIKDLVSQGLNVQGVTDAMDVQQILDLAPKEKLQTLKELGLKVKALQRKQRGIENRQKEASKITNTEDNTARTNSLIDIADELVKNQQEIQLAESERQVALDAIGVQNYTDANVTVEMLENQTENLKKLQGAISDIRNIDPQRYSQVEKLLLQQSKAVQHIKNYDATVRSITNPNTRVRIVNGWLTKLLNKNTELEEGTAKFFTSVLENYNKDAINITQVSGELDAHLSFQRTGEVSEAYKDALGFQLDAGETLTALDQEIYNKFHKEIDAKRKAKIVAKSADDIINEKIAELEKERDSKVINSEPAQNTTTDKADIERRRQVELTERENVSIGVLTPTVISDPNSKFFGYTQDKIKPLVQKAIKSVSNLIEEWFNTKTINNQKSEDISKARDLIQLLNANPFLKYFRNNALDGIRTFLENKEKGIEKRTLEEFLTDSTDKISAKYDAELAQIESTPKTDTNKTNKEYSKKIDALKSQLSTAGSVTVLQKLKNKVKELLSNNKYVADYVGEDVSELSKIRPNETDVKEYETLISKINRKVEPNVAKVIGQPSDTYKNIGLSIEEIDRLKELNNTLNRWMLLDGTQVNDQQSVADLLNIINSLESQVEKKNVKVELNDKDFKATIDAVDGEVSSSGNSVAGLITPTTALATIQQGNVRFSHISLDTLAGFFGGTSLLNENNTFEIFLPTGEKLAGKKNEKNGFDVKLTDWNAVRGLLNVLIKNFGTNSATISQFIGQDTNGVDLYRDVPSDFDYRQTNGENLVIDEDAVNSIKNGDELTLKISSTDAFNAGLKPKDLASQIHIYVYKGDKLVGSLPASNGKQSVDGIGMSLIDLRTEATEFTKGKKGLITLPQQMTAKIVFIGQPNITLEKASEGVVTTKQNEFTKEALQTVVGTGFIQNGEVTSNVNIDANQFIKKLSSVNSDTRIPFVVFNMSGKNIAFPITLKTTTFDRGTEVRDFLNGDSSTTIKAKTLIDALTQNGLDPNSYTIDFSDNENWMTSDEVERALDDLSNITESVDLDQFAGKNYKKEALVNDATIAIDLSNKPFQTNKVMISVSNKINGDVLGYKEFQKEVEAKIIETRTALNEVAKEVYSQYIKNGDLENNFTEVFDDAPIEKGTSDVIMRRNVNTLRTALKGISAKTKGVIGTDLVNKANNLIKELDGLGKREKDVKEQIKNSESYQNTDPLFITVDENGELENPAVNEADAIGEIGGIKIKDEYDEVLENSDLDYLKTEDVFDEMSEFNRIPAKTINENGELVDLETSTVKETLENTLQEPKSVKQFSGELAFIDGLSPNSWRDAKEVKILLKHVGKLAVEMGIDLQDFDSYYDTKAQAEVQTLLRTLDRLINNQTQTNLNTFIETYREFIGDISTPKEAVLRLRPELRNETRLVQLETENSDYKMFREYGLLRVQDGVYLRVDENQTLAEIEAIKAPIENIEAKMAEIKTNDSEYDADTLKKMLYYSEEFPVAPTAKKTIILPTTQLEVSDNIVYEMRVRQIKAEKGSPLNNLVFSDKGIQLKYTDVQSVAEMNDLLKDEQELRNYFLMSKNTNFAVENNEIVEDFETTQTERDSLINGAKKEEFRGEVKMINPFTIQPKAEENFITVNDENYERVEGDLFVKLSVNNSQFYTLNNQAPTLNVDANEYLIQASEPKVEKRVLYSKRQGENITKEIDNCG